MTLNEDARRAADALVAHADRWRVAVSEVAGATLIDCGAGVPGGLAAGLQLARVCLADRAEVALVPGEFGPAVQVFTDDPIRACLASQYAGWQVKADKYFAMGSGPMRAAYGREALFDDIPGRETPPVAVGVLETRKAPPPEILAYLVERLPSVQSLTLAFAPASSVAGTVQVVARALETALHKLHALHFPLSAVLSGHGVAPLPPVAADELVAIGRTNDAILYAGRVSLWVRCDDALIEEFGPKVPSSASPDHGAPFAEIFARAGDFYKIDPLLFSPAELAFHNLQTGRTFAFGRAEPDVYRRSIAG